MSRRELINTFLKLDTDTSQNKQDNTSFYDGQNLRVISDEALTNGALVNFKGTKAKINLGGGNIQLKGYAEVGDELALLLHKVPSSEPPIIEVITVPDMIIKNYTGTGESIVFEWLTTYSIGTFKQSGLCSVNFTPKVVLTDNGEIVTNEGEPVIVDILLKNLPDITLIYKVINKATGVIFKQFKLFNLDSPMIIESIPSDGNEYELIVDLFVPEDTVSTFLLDDISFTYYTDNVTVGGNLIAKVTPSNNNTIQDITIVYSDTTSTEKLAFDTVESVSTIGVYENDNSKKVYFAVQDKPLRFFNIASDDLSTVDASNLDVLPNAITNSITIEGVIDGGVIENGKIQYTCRMFNKYGAETSFSASTDLISITNNSSSYTAISGGDIGKSSGKAVNIKVVLDNTNTYRYVRLYAIHYTTQGVPSVYLVGEKEVVANQITFIDNGIKNDVLTLEEYNIFGGRLISAEVIEEKNNILFAANLKESQDTIPPELFDTRAYRFKNLTWQGDSTAMLSHIYESDDVMYPSYYQIHSNGEVRYYKYNYSIPGYEQIGYNTNFNIPLTADCINKYNNEFLKPSGDWTEKFDYDRTSTRLLGGTGKIISYLIKTSDAVKVVDGGKVIFNNDNSNAILKSKTLKQGEVYRFGIVPYDLKGKPYFVSWIGDIRIPYFEGLQDIFKTTLIAPGNNLTIELKNVYVEFTINVNNIPDEVKNKISGFQIVQVERTENDRSIVAQGWSNGGVIYSSAINGYGMRTVPNGYRTLDGMSVDDDTTNTNKYYYPFIHQFISPEFNINEGKQLEAFKYRLRINKIIKKVLYRAGSGTYLSFINKTNTPTTTIPITHTITSGVTADFNASSISNKKTPIDGSLTTVHKNTSFDIIDALNVSTKDLDDTSFYILRADGTQVRVKNRNISNINYSAEHDSNSEYRSEAPTGAIFSSNYPLLVVNYNEGLEHWVYQLDLYKDNATTRYGGNTYFARSVNQYIAASDFIKIGQTKLVTRGDIYNSIFDILISGKDGEKTDPVNQQTALYPIESSVNCFLTSVKPSTIPYNYLVKSQSKGIQLRGDEYPLVGDLNRYNTVYSQVSKYPIYLPKPSLFDEITREPYTITHSSKKTRGEFVDNWSKFLYANSIEVSGKYGAIHGLTNVNNKLIFLQEDAIGTTAVNERYLIGENAAQLALGTGGVLERYDYLKYNAGIIKPQHFINTEDSVFYVDVNRGVIDKLSDSAGALSFIKGINSLTRYLLSITNYTVRLGYDGKYKEVLFTIGAGLNSKTIVFNIMTDNFAPLHATTPNLYLSLNKGLMSFVPTNIEGEFVNNYIYKHNVGEFGERYTEANIYDEGANIAPAYVAFLVNTKSPRVSIFDNIEFNTEVRALTGTEYTTGPFADTTSIRETVDRIEFKNSYQTKEVVITVKDKADGTPLATGTVPNASRRVRGWAMAVPLSNTAKRFTDSFLSIKMQYDNSENKLFKLHDVITYIREANK